MNKSMVYAYTGVVITMLFWGSAFNAMSYVIQYMPPLSAAAERFTIASLGLFILFTAMGKLHWVALRQNLAIYLIIGIIGIAGFNLGCFYSFTNHLSSQWRFNDGHNTFNYFAVNNFT